MIARMWRGLTPEAQADAYFDYLMKTGVPALRATPGNRGVYIFRRLVGGGAEFVLISLWESFEAIRLFAGPEPEKAVYYPEDREFLLELEPLVSHFEVLLQP